MRGCCYETRCRWCGVSISTKDVRAPLTEVATSPSPRPDPGGRGRSSSETCTCIVCVGCASDGCARAVSFAASARARACGGRPGEGSLRAGDRSDNAQTPRTHSIGRGRLFNWREPLLHVQARELQPAWRAPAHLLHGGETHRGVERDCVEGSAQRQPLDAPGGGDLLQLPQQH